MLWYEVLCELFLALGKELPSRAEYCQELIIHGDWTEIYRKYGIPASLNDLENLEKSPYKARMHRAKLSYGAKRILLRLKKRGVYLVLLTGQIEELVVPLLDKFSLSAVFDEYFFRSVDKKSIIEKFLREHQASPNDCFLIGDAPSDMHHAKQTGICAIGFLDRANSETSLKAAGADFCIRKFAELEAIL